jgi:hypothetical protein
MGCMMGKESGMGEVDKYGLRGEPRLLIAPGRSMTR